MFSSLAWMRALFCALLLLSVTTPFTHAREETIYTSSVTYCEPPSTLLISRFEVAYFPHNSSVAFNISAASVQPTNVSASLFLNTYGLHPLNITIDLCQGDILGGALCPLPVYNFTGGQVLTLPPSIDVTSKIPSIGFKIPDLEGFAQLTLTDVRTGAVKACVQATLANGWSAHQPAVEWTTGGIAIAGMLAAFAVSLWVPNSIVPFRFLDLMLLYQFIASSALLSLNFSSVYRAFALNFAWALGLFPATEDSVIQRSIDKMRHRTGGHLADEATGAAVQYVNRKLSPYNFEPRNLLGRAETVRGEVQTVTTSSSNVLQAGLPIYVNSVHVPVANAFMTAFICALILFAIGIVVLIVGYGVHFLLNRRKGASSNGVFCYLTFARSWILRLSLITLTPLITLIFYQWTLKDSWVTILLSVLALAAMIALVGWSVLQVILLARTRSAFDLYNLDEPRPHFPLYGQFWTPRYYFFLVALVEIIFRALFIAFVKSNGTVQIALLVALQGLVFLSYVVLRPFKTRGGDVFGTYLSLTRFVCTGLMLGFLQPLAVSPIPRVVIGIVIAVIFSVAVLVTIINLAMNIVMLFFKKSAPGEENQSSGASSSDKSILAKPEAELDDAEKGALREADSRAQFPVARPTNPTPEQGHALEFDSAVLQPFPISPTGSTVTTMDPPSVYSRRTSESITVGSLLPRRWSFSYSQPNSPSGSEVHGTSVPASPGQTPSSEGYLSRRTSDSNHLVPTILNPPSSSPSAWAQWTSRRTSKSRPGSSGAHSNRSSRSGILTRSGSTKLQNYQQNHERIPEVVAVAP